MTSRKLAAATAGAAAALIFATTAFAQTPPAATTPPPMTHGAVIPGMCIFSRAEVLATSTVGKHVSTRMDQLLAAVSAEVQPEANIINAEAKTLESSKATMDKATWDKRQTDMLTRGAALERKLALRQRELEVTSQKAVNRVYQEMEPIAVQVYQQRRCSVLIAGEGVMAVNPAMNITPAVVQGLNARIQTFAFERERLDQQAAAPAAAR